MSYKRMQHSRRALCSLHPYNSIQTVT